MAEIAAARGLSVHTVLGHRGQHESWPEPVGTRTVPRGRPMLEYDADAIDEFYRVKDETIQARRGVRADAAWHLNDLVGASVAAARLQIPGSTFRTYPALYPPRSAHPFPARFTGPRRRWSADGMVDAETAAARLEIPVSTFLTYPGTYRSGRRNSFPPERDGRWRWGDLLAWASHCYRWGAVLTWARSRPGSGHPAIGTSQSSAGDRQPA